MSGTVETSHVCWVCGGDRFSTTAWRGYHLMRCRGCGLILRWPPPDPAAETRYYREAYYPAPNVVVWDARRLGLYARPLRWIEGRVPGRRLLDVGCGYGHFLALARDRGWEVTGLEPSGQAAAAARGIPGVRVVEGTVAELACSPERFDCVTAWNVLDQVASPRRDLAVLAGLLSPGGWLLLRVLNGAVHYVAWRWVRLSPPALFHNYGFSARALAGLLRAAGLEEIAVRNSRLAGDLPEAFGRGPGLLVTTAAAAFAGAAAILSGGRLRLAPSLLAFARRP